MTMTHPDDIPVDTGDEEAGLDPSTLNAARVADADEADLIEQAIAIPLGDDDHGVDR
jgi:hypothetical protein